jgi:hypothetical protein
MTKEPPDHGSQLPGELLNRTLHDRTCLGRAFGKEGIQLLLADLVVACLRAQRISDPPDAP